MGWSDWIGGSGGSSSKSKSSSSGGVKKTHYLSTAGKVVQSGTTRILLFVRVAAEKLPTAFLTKTIEKSDISPGVEPG